jgi:hypothetical protein
MSRRGVVGAGVLAVAGCASGGGCVTQPNAAPTPPAAPAPGRIVKSMTLLVRKPSWTHLQFMRYWLDVHAPMALDIPGMTGMVCAEILGPTRRRLDIPRGADIEIDGVAESWKLDSNSPGNPDAPPEARAWYSDGPEFVGLIKGFRVRENIVMRPRRGGRGLLSLLNRKPGMTREEFAHEWVDTHGPMARTVPEVDGLILNEIDRVAARDDIPPLEGFDDIDGIAESWHVDQNYPGVTSAEGRAWYAHGAETIGMARGYYTQEHVIIEPR